ncbi:MAG: YidC/Oxa1 family membrane protein insertase [Solirubrobacterales bacterium]|nr:YidC/Oxa1 family membrane protein insertase [Solirubrobacterales bacterium]
MIPLEAHILQPLIDAANAVLSYFHFNIGLQWGFAIVLLTICTRALLIPLTYKQLKGMRALQAFQPQIKALQEKYKNDRQRLSQEMMNFYKENKINPLASCIPLLAQLPIFITLFYTLKGPLREDMCGQESMSCGDVPFSAVQNSATAADFEKQKSALVAAGDVTANQFDNVLHHFSTIKPLTDGVSNFGEKFFFIPDLTANAVGAVLITLMILYVGTQLISGMITATTGDRNQKILMMVLPFIFIPFIISFPAGLVVYWITTNVWTIGQQAAVNKFIPAPVVPTPEMAAAAKPPPQPPKKKKRRR